MNEVETVRTPEVTDDVREQVAEPTRVGELVFGAVLFALGVVALTQVRVIPGNEGWAVSGPRFVPLVVCSAWVLLAALYVFQVARKLRATRGERLGRTVDWAPLLLVVTLVVYANVVIGLGYVIATALSFVVGARILGSRKLVRDIVIGVLIAVAVYFSFTQLLSIRLPAGVLPL